MLKEFEEFFHICFGNQDCILEYKIKKIQNRPIHIKGVISKRGPICTILKTYCHINKDSVPIKFHTYIWVAIPKSELNCIKLGKDCLRYKISLMTLFLKIG